MEHPADGFGKVLAKLDRRHIYCHRHCGKPFVLPFPGLRAGSSKHPFPDWHDQAAVLSNSYEPIRRHEAQLRVLPAEERDGDVFDEARPAETERVEDNLQLSLWVVKKEHEGGAG